jgi:signal transduction histidine kinase
MPGAQHQPCDCAVVDLMRLAFESKQQALRVSLPKEAVWVEGDSTRLEQIITNLSSNANKHTHERGEIELKLRTTFVKAPVSCWP